MIAAASIRLRVVNTTVDGPAIFRTAAHQHGGSHGQDDVEQRRPARIGTTPVGDFAGMSPAGTSHSTAVGGITGAGIVTLELAPHSDDDPEFSSREDSTTANRPVLTLTVRSG